MAPPRRRVARLDKLLPAERCHSLKDLLYAPVRLSERPQGPEIGLRQLLQALVVRHPQPDVSAVEEVRHAGRPVHGRVAEEVVGPVLREGLRLRRGRQEAEVEGLGLLRLVGCRRGGNSRRLQGLHAPEAHDLLEVGNQVLAALDDLRVERGSVEVHAGGSTIVLPPAQHEEQPLEPVSPEHAEDLLAAALVQAVLDALDQLRRRAEPHGVGPARHGPEVVAGPEGLQHALDVLGGPDHADVRLNGASAQVLLHPGGERAQRRSHAGRPLAGAGALPKLLLGDGLDGLRDGLLDGPGGDLRDLRGRHHGLVHGLGCGPGRLQDLLRGLRDGLHGCATGAARWRLRPP
mmetsp:Transcript_5340/g.11167  ORF Transcript_5340/g.11167 Transcript_5340/m.11167 type:complete len:347 (-) Transcript_5340:7-1047(-)